MFFSVFALAIVFIFSLSFAASLNTFKSSDIKTSLLAKKKTPFLALTLTFVATQLGGSAIIASSESALNKGAVAILYTSGLSLGFLMHALGFGKRMRNAEVSTVSELFEKYYGSFSLRVLSSFIVIISLSLILASIAVGSWQFLQSLGIQTRLPFYLLWSLVIIYTSFGGLNAVIKTDMIQVCFVLSIFALISSFFGFELNGQALNSLVHLTSQSQDIPADLYISWLLMPTIFTLIGQDMGQRCFSANSAQTVSKSTAAAALILFLAGTLPVGLGLTVKTHLPEASNFSDILSFLKEHSPILAGLFAAATATALLSTADSLLCAVGSSLAFDIFQPLFPNAKESTLHKISTFSIFLIGFGSVLSSLYLDNMMDLVIFAYTISVITLSAPIICAILFGRHPLIVPCSSLLIGLTTYYVGYTQQIDFYDTLALSVSFLPFVLYRSQFLFKTK